MHVPCQVAHWYLIPAIGAKLTAELRKRGMSQRQIANALGMSEAAISHYAKGKRGADFPFDRTTAKNIGALADKIKKGAVDEDGIVNGICSLCVSARKSKSVCTLHRKDYNVGKCTVCTGGKHACV